MKNFSSSKSNSYPRMVRLDLEALNIAIQDKRIQLNISEREISRLIGEKTPSSLTRLKQGKQPSIDLFIRIVTWLGVTDINQLICDVE